jgi:hypothetical protein
MSKNGFKTGPGVEVVLQRRHLRETFRGELAVL